MANQIALQAQLRNAVIEYIKRRGEQVFAQEIKESVEVNQIGMERIKRDQWCSVTLNKMSKEGLLGRTRSYDPRWPKANFAYWIPQEGQTVTYEAKRAANATNAATADTPNTPNALDEAAQRAARDVERAERRRAQAREAKRKQRRERSLASLRQQVEGTGDKAVAPAAEVKLVKLNGHPVVAPRLDIMVDMDGKGATLTLAGMTIHIGVQGAVA